MGEDTPERHDGDAEPWRSPATARTPYADVATNADDGDRWPDASDLVGQHVDGRLDDDVERPVADGDPPDQGKWASSAEVAGDDDLDR